MSHSCATGLLMNPFGGGWQERLSCALHCQRQSGIDREDSIYPRQCESRPQTVKGGVRARIVPRHRASISRARATLTSGRGAWRLGAGRAISRRRAAIVRTGAQVAGGRGQRRGDARGRDGGGGRDRGDVGAWGQRHGGGRRRRTRGGRASTHSGRSASTSWERSRQGSAHWSCSCSTPQRGRPLWRRCAAASIQSQRSCSSRRYSTRELLVSLQHRRQEQPLSSPVRESVVEPRRERSSRSTAPIRSARHRAEPRAASPPPEREARAELTPHAKRPKDRRESDGQANGQGASPARPTLQPLASNREATAAPRVEGRSLDRSASTRQVAQSAPGAPHQTASKPAAGSRGPSAANQ